MMTINNFLVRTTPLVLVAFCLVNQVAAQLVFVPDTSLRTALNTWVPGCVDASGNLDTGDPAVLTQSSLVLTVDWTTVDLTGVGALTNLTSLSVLGRSYDVMQDNLVPSDSGTFSIPSWPSGLVSLKLDRGTWNVLPPFPTGLNSLYIDAPGQAVIPTVPSGVTALTVVDQATLSAFPGIPAGVTSLTLTSHGNPFPTFQEGIERLILKSAPGVALPALPNSVDSLYLEKFDATSIPAWPSSAHTIHALHLYQVEQVAPFPDSLSYLSLQGFDSLQGIPPFPTNLNTLSLIFCSALQSVPPFPATLHDVTLWDMWSLDSVPQWPNSIASIYVAALHVAELPPFPSSLGELYVGGLDSLSCLPLLPQGLTDLYLDAESPFSYGPTPITCLPNFPPAFTLHWNTLWETPQDPDLLCTSLNSSCPFLNPVATGAVYWDQNANGTREPGEPGYPFATLHQQPENAMHGVAADGSFAWPMPIGNYTLTTSGTSPYVQSVSPAQYALSFTSNGQVLTGNDFGAVLQPNIQDLRIDLTELWGVPGFDAYGTITCQNVGTIPVDATVTFQLDADLDWVSGTPVPASVNGNTVTWSVPALQVGETRQLSVVAHTDENVPLGTPITSTAQIDPVASDATPADNVSVANSEVVAPVDPNDKQVEPAALTPAEVSSDAHELTYTIRFQNTGNWPAVNVVVLDTLSPDLQWSSFHLVSSGHPCTWELSDGGVLSFRFEGINLPDSTNDEPHSHGFVKFAIKPATTLQQGMIVANSADILFDFNAPVRTLPAVFTVDDEAGIQETAQSMIQVFPNPVNEVVNLRVNTTGIARIQVLDALGREQLQEKATTGGMVSLPVHGLASGFYTLRCTTESGTWSTKFLKR